MYFYFRRQYLLTCRLLDIQHKQNTMKSIPALLHDGSPHCSYSLRVHALTSVWNLNKTSWVTKSHRGRAAWGGRSSNSWGVPTEPLQWIHIGKDSHFFLFALRVITLQSYGKWNMRLLHQERLLLLWCTHNSTVTIHGSKQVQEISILKNKMNSFVWVFDQTSLKIRKMQM